MNASDLIKAFKEKKISPVESAREALVRARAADDLKIFLRLDEEKIMAQARASEERWSKGKAGSLEGVPVSIKDNICEKGEFTTCASRILENFISPYDATVIGKLKDAGAILFGRTNMDEFAMGSSTENSAFQKTLNPRNKACVPGGSSGGAAASVAAGIVPLALGSDTGGSIRQPAAFCGTMGLKPTYGMVSRYGLVAFASSLDQIGPLAMSASDLLLALNAIRGRDWRDATSSVEADRSVEPQNIDFKKLRVGLISFNKSTCDAEVVAAYEEKISELSRMGASIVELPFDLEKYLIPVYYILAPAEASSNLSRFDGVRYGFRAKNPKSMLDLYTGSRTEGFGSEVKRRILTGTYVLSSGYYDAYYKKAQQIRAAIQIAYADFYKRVDVILQPTTPTPAFRFGEKSADPLQMYQSDVLTVAANLAGIPALSLPAGLNREGLPIGIQLSGNYFSEGLLLSLAQVLEGKIPSGEPAASKKEKQSVAKEVQTEKPSEKKRSTKEDTANNPGGKNLPVMKTAFKKAPAEKNPSLKIPEKLKKKAGPDAKARGKASAKKSKVTGAQKKKK